MHTKQTLSRDSSRVTTGGISLKGLVVSGPGSSLTGGLSVWRCFLNEKIRWLPLSAQAPWLLTLSSGRYKGAHVSAQRLREPSAAHTETHDPCDVECLPQPLQAVCLMPVIKIPTGGDVSTRSWAAEDTESLLWTCLGLGTLDTINSLFFFGTFFKERKYLFEPHMLYKMDPLKNEYTHISILYK